MSKIALEGIKMLLHLCFDLCYDLHHNFITKLYIISWTSWFDFGPDKHCEMLDVKFLINFLCVFQI